MKGIRAIGFDAIVKQLHNSRWSVSSLWTVSLANQYRGSCENEGKNVLLFGHGRHDCSVLWFGVPISPAGYIHYAVLWPFLIADCSVCMCWSPMVADTQLLPAQADAGVLPACGVHDAEHNRVYVGSWKGSNPEG